MTSCQDALARSDATTDPIDAASLNAGMITLTEDGSAMGKTGSYVHLCEWAPAKPENAITRGGENLA